MLPLFKTPLGSYHFFGYYDKSPFDADNVRLLSQRAMFMDRMPDKDDILEIGYFDWQHGNDFIKLTETSAWNWQQGCMLQWVGPDFRSNIIYNDRLDGKFVSVLMNIESKEKTILPMSIYSMHPSGKYAVCIDNERHFWVRNGYSYQGVENLDKRLDLNKNDGIWLLDIDKREVAQIINIKDLLRIDPLSCMDQATHYIEHLMFSPNGEQFCFLHRWEIEDGGIYARLYTANIKGGEIYLLNDSGRVSHFCWRNNEEIMAWCGLKTAVNHLRKHKNIIKFFIQPLLPLYHKFIQGQSGIRSLVTGDSYVLFIDKGSVKERVYPKVLKEDGHPSFCPKNDELFVTDTYQDCYNYRHLFIVNIKNGVKTELTSLRSSPLIDDTSIRCDLHPKWSFDGRYLCVDTVDSKCRQMYVFDVSNMVSVD
jgi:hypothetical protein